MKSAGLYRSPLREAQAAATRERVVEACVAVMRRRAELTYAAVAAEAGVQERTVYRHFSTKEQLEHAVWEWIVEHLTHAELDATNEPELIRAMRESFAGFDAGAPLIEAMLHSRQGLAVRRRQQPRRSAMFEACVTAAAPNARPRTRESAAAVLQVLYSAAAWEQLRNFLRMDATRAGDAIELGIHCFLAGLREAGDHPSTHRHAAPRRRRNTA